MRKLAEYCFCIALWFTRIALFSSYDQSIDLRNKLHHHLSAGNYKDILKHVKKIEDEFGTLVIDGLLPSLYLYKGVAYHGLHLLQDAEAAFQEGLRYFPNEAR
jgi:tetratricopeptide (TPR) repeat protein